MSPLSSELLLRVMIREYLLRGVVDPQGTEKDFGHALMAKVTLEPSLLVCLPPHP